MARKRRGRSEGSIFQRTDGLWVTSVSLGYNSAGKRRRRTVYGKTKEEVQKKLRILQTSADTGTLSDAGRLTVAEYMARWLENVARPRVAASTYERYEQLIRLHVNEVLGGVQLAKLHAVHIEGFFTQLERNGATASARRRVGKLLSSALRHAVRLKLIPFNPAADVLMPRPEHKEMLFLTEPQVRQFLDAAEGRRLFPLFAMALGTGMRQGELLGLRWADIDFESATVSVQRSLSQTKGELVIKEPKSRSGRRTITLPPFALDAMRCHRARMLAEGNIGGPVFCTRPGKFITKSNLIRCSFKPVIAKANARATELAKGGEPALLPPIRFHDLRHTHATLLLSQGHSIRAVASRLGHAKADVTLRVYAHVLPNDDRMLAEGLGRLYG